MLSTCLKLRATLQACKCTCVPEGCTLGAICQGCSSVVRLPRPAETRIQLEAKEGHSPFLLSNFWVHGRVLPES